MGRVAGWIVLFVVVLFCTGGSVAAASRPVWNTPDVRVDDPKATFGGTPRGSREPVVAIDPTNVNRMIAVAIDQNPQNQVPAGDGYAGWSHIYRSTDAGKTWHSIRLIRWPEADKRYEAGDPSVVFDSHGVVYVSALDDDLITPHHRNIGVYRSTDSGLHWTGPYFAFQGVINPDGQRCSSADKELLGINPKTNELLLTYTGTTWKCGTPIDDEIVGQGAIPPDATIDIMLVRSRDGGKTWTKPTSLWHAYAIAARPVVAQDGTMYVAFTASAPVGTTLTCPSAVGTIGNVKPSEFEMVVLTSRDNGTSWNTERQPMCDGSVLATQRAETLGDADPTGGAFFGNVNIDPSTGTVYAVWPSFAPEPPNARFGIELVSSKDRGHTWSAPMLLSPPSEDSVLPTIAAQNGVVGAAWMGTNDSWNSYRVMSSTSIDAGRTWSTPTQLSSAAASGDGEIGDYIWSDARAGRFAAIWTQNRSGSATDIYFRTTQVDTHATPNVSTRRASTQHHSPGERIPATGERPVWALVIGLTIALVALGLARLRRT